MKFARWSGNGVIVLCALLLVSSIGAIAPTARSPKFSPALSQAFATQSIVNYLVIFNDDADLSGAPAIGNRNTRRQFVYDRLRAQAQRTHASARALLEANGVTFREHYLLNALDVSSDAAIAQQLAALAEVTRLDVNMPTRADLPQPTNQLTNEPTSVVSIEWGVTRVHAPDVWNTFGVHGEGVVVGTADTGVQWDHPALKAHYRGWNGASANHNYNWHDAIHDGTVVNCLFNATAPCDDYGHGTHVTGTMVGDDGAGNQIGVAPGAKWIGCRNMDANGDGTPARYTECFEFMLAPYPIGGNPLTQGRPELGADIINNSWTCPASEGCTTGDELRAEVQKLNAAGILVVAAAGNPGSTCGGVAEAPARYAETFTVGATDSGDNIAGFSARGPVTADGSNRRKPDVSAPGVNVRSSFPNNSYGTASGTSMASPHTSGVAALLWSAVPTMTGNIALTTFVIEHTADAKTAIQLCGSDTTSSVPNNVYGYGIVNALSAIQYARTFKQTYLPLIMKP